MGTELTTFNSISRTYECSAMHNIPNTYPSLNPSEHMIGESESVALAGVSWRNRLSRTYEADISIIEISEELKLDQWTVKRPLKLLGYGSAII